MITPDNWRDISIATEDDKEVCFGREFRAIPMLRMNSPGPGSCLMVECLIEGRKVALIGDPQEALRTYLGGIREGGERLAA